AAPLGATASRNAPETGPPRPAARRSPLARELRCSGRSKLRATGTRRFERERRATRRIRILRRAHESPPTNASHLALFRENTSAFVRPHQEHESPSLPPPRRAMTRRRRAVATAVAVALLA